MGNVGDNGVSSYRLHAYETQQMADATPICYLCGAARGAAVNQECRTQARRPQARRTRARHRGVTSPPEVGQKPAT